MIKVTMTVFSHRGQEEWCTFHDPYQKEEAKAYKAENPEANVIMFRLDADGTYLYGPIIENGQ